MHYLTIGLITEEELSSPLRAQPELLRALSPAWLQGFQDDIRRRVIWRTVTVDLIMTRR